MARIIFLAIFFAISYYFAMNRSTVIDKVGNYLTPALLITLLAIVVLAILTYSPCLKAGDSWIQTILAY